MAGNRNYYNRYMYETSPRKVKPDYIPNPKIKEKQNLRIQKQNENIKHAKERKLRTIKFVTCLVLGFSLLFALCYRNSQINESFKQLNDTKEALALIEKENEQLEVEIESNLNLSNIEQIAKEQLGMQKATSSQTRYVSLAKKDYVESAVEEIKVEQNSNIFQRIAEYISNLF